MFAFPWFPVGYALPGGPVGRLLREGSGYQIVDNQTGESASLILESATLVAMGAYKFLDPINDGFYFGEFGGRSYLSRRFERSEQPIIVRDWPKVMGLPTSSDASSLGKALRRMREVFPKAELGGSLFLPSFSVCLPINEKDGVQDLRSLAVELLTGGARVSLADVNSICAINSWLAPQEIEAFFGALGVDCAQAKVRPQTDPTLSRCQADLSWSGSSASTLSNRTWTVSATQRLVSRCRTEFYYMAHRVQERATP